MLDTRSDLILRKVESKDKDSVLEWRNSEAVRPYMYNDSVITKEDHDRWFFSMLQDDSKSYWIIELENNPVGVVNLTNISQTNKSCDWAFYIFDPSVRGKGVGSYVEKSILHHVFEELKLNKLNCEVLETNEKVVEMHKKFGFKQEGFFRDLIKRGDKFVGVYRLSMLLEDYELSKKPKTSIDRDLEIIDKIQTIRSKNNINWMDVLRLCLKENNKEAKKIIANINSHDSQISALVEELAKNE